MPFERYLAVIYGSNPHTPTLVGILPDDTEYVYPVFRAAQAIPRAHIQRIFRHYVNVQGGEEVEWRFYRDFPPRALTMQSAGWLAPDGKFFPCRHAEHDMLAMALANIYYGEALRSGASRLEAHNWLRISIEGTLACFPDMKQVTAGQIDTMATIAELHTYPNYTCNMYNMLNIILELRA